MSDARAKYFAVSEPSSLSGMGRSDAGSLPIGLMSVGQEVQLAHVKLKHIHSNDRVVFQGTVGWQGNTSLTATELAFRIYRDGELQFETVDVNQNVNPGTRVTTSLHHSETNVNGQTHEYSLRVALVGVQAPQRAAELALQSAQLMIAPLATIIGPIHFDGVVMDENE